MEAIAPVFQKTASERQKYGRLTPPSSARAYRQPKLSPAAAIAWTIHHTLAASAAIAVFANSPAFPNPFNSTATIRYSLPAAGWASLGVYDLNGRLVERLMEGEMGAGWHEAVWEAEGLPSGFYIARLECGNASLMKKLSLLK